MLQINRRQLTLCIFIGLTAGFCGLLISAAKGLGFSASVTETNLKVNQSQVMDKPNLTAASRVVWSGDIENQQLNESSGLANSNLAEDTLWSINDSGDTARIFALRTTGEDLGEWSINVDHPTDWEAMDSFMLDGKAYLLIADVGDNFAWRKNISLLLLAEPSLSSDHTKAIEPLWVKTFRFPDGARDCEAVTVDSVRGEILLLTKRIFPNELYRLPLQHEILSSSVDLLAEKIALINSIPRVKKGDESLYGSAAAFIGMPTGMDISGDKIIVTTLKSVYLLDRSNLEKPASEIKMPYAGQREAITFAKDKSSVAYVSRERKNGEEIADIFRVDF
jgi:hypothetical protein